MDSDFKMPPRTDISNKSTFGRILNISGSDYMPGAACLSSLAALTTGCGYVFLCSTQKVIEAVAAQTQNIVFCPLQEMETQLKTANVLLYGCGVSLNKEAVSNFKKIFSKPINIPTIIDADGLNILAEHPETKLPENLILTPHPKEAARLLKTDTDKILGNMQFYAKEISKKYNCITVLKSHITIICSKDLEIYENNKPNSALAKAGSGDVLAGIIAGLLAQNCEPFYAAKLGVYLHSITAELAKNNLTEYGVLAADLVRLIPNAIKTLL